MERVKAQELIENGEYISRLSMEGLYRLLVRAGFSQEEAHSEAKEHGLERLAAGKTI